MLFHTEPDLVGIPDTGNEVQMSFAVRLFLSPRHIP